MCVRHWCGVMSFSNKYINNSNNSNNNNNVQTLRDNAHTHIWWRKLRRRRRQVAADDLAVLVFMNVCVFSFNFQICIIKYIKKIYLQFNVFSVFFSKNNNNNKKCVSMLFFHYFYILFLCTKLWKCCAAAVGTYVKKKHGDNQLIL